MVETQLRGYRVELRQYPDGRMEVNYQRDRVVTRRRTEVVNNGRLKSTRRCPTMVVKQGELKNLRVLLIGFSPVVRAGLQAILAKDQGIEVMGDAADGREALPQLKQHYAQGRPIDVVLTETRPRRLDGVQATRLIRDEFLGVSVLVLTEFDNDSNVIDAIQAGAGGYIFLKDMTTRGRGADEDGIAEQGRGRPDSKRADDACRAHG